MSCKIRALCKFSYIYSGKNVLPHPQSWLNSYAYGQVNDILLQIVIDFNERGSASARQR